MPNTTQKSHHTLFRIQRNCALWTVVLQSSGKVVYTSLSRKNCLDFIAENEPINSQNQ
jgi:hypothetical protein